MQGQLAPVVTVVRAACSAAPVMDGLGTITGCCQSCRLDKLELNNLASAIMHFAFLPCAHQRVVFNCHTAGMRRGTPCTAAYVLLQPLHLPDAAGRGRRHGRESERCYAIAPHIPRRDVVRRCRVVIQDRCSSMRTRIVCKRAQ